jgi:FAD/FMN-containing dehydrogenase
MLWRRRRTSTIRARALPAGRARATLEAMSQALSPSPDSALLDALRNIVGARHLLTAEADVAPHLMEWRGLYRGATRAVVKPGSTREVAAVLALASDLRVPVVPQGGNTGLVGGQIPFERGEEIVVSLTRMNAIREVDPASDTLTVDAGVTLKAAQEAAEAVDRLFPLSLGSEGTCTIGGNLSTNAGGVAVLAYGNARDLVLGLEVVLADGRVMHGLNKLRKDNTGYDLKHLFMGAEGTLGIITGAVLKLFPRPKSRATAFCGLSDPRAALALLERAKRMSGGALTGFEIVPRIGIDFVTRHLAGARDPLPSSHEWYVLMELSSQAETGTDAALEAILAAALEAGEIADAAIAASLDQRAAFWRMREALAEVQGREGGSIKHDVSVPVAAVAEFIGEADAIVTRMIPGCRPVAFGHLGDGNIHYNVSQPVGADKAAFLARWGEVNDAVHALVGRFHGSVSAEHGIGRLKRDLLARVKDPVALATMRAIKATLDPNNILNPGKVL